jgi:hypothetical protein
MCYVFLHLASPMLALASVTAAMLRERVSYYSIDLYECALLLYM